MAPTLTDRRLTLLLVGLVSALALVMQMWMWDWTVDDAAISFAYARHIAAGEGPVAFPGGEWVEGFSNPTWTLLLAWLDLVGVNPFAGAKWAAAVATVLTVWLVFALGRRLTAEGDPVPAGLAATLFAINPQVAIWGASGLENALFSLLLALGLHRLLVEHDRQSQAVWSAAVFALIVFTRPEGALYAGVGAACAVALNRTRPRYLLWWFAAAAAPVLIGELARLAIFAWPLPNTYYAKLGDGLVSPWGLDSKGWAYVLAWAGAARIGWQLPVLAVGLMASPGRAVRLLCGALALCSVAFAVLAGGDWMTGFRFLSFLAVPLSLLAAAGVWDIARFVGRGWAHGAARALLPAAAVALLLVPSHAQMAAFRTAPETSTTDILRRVAYNNGIQRALHLDRVTNLEVDMGATLYWSGDDLLDIAGLTDVPIAHHGHGRPFVTEYIFTEHRPELMHTHGDWASRLGVRRIRSWREDWFELPGYGPTGARHRGCMVRRDLFTTDSWSGPTGRDAAFEDGVHLVGWQAPAGSASRRGTLHLELAMKIEVPRDRDFEVWLTLTQGGTTASWSVPIGYGWYPPSKWRPHEIVTTHLAVPMNLLPIGRYDLGIVVVSPDDVLLPRSVADGVGAPALDGSPPRMNLAEVTFPNAVAVLTEADARARQLDHLTDLDASADAGRCAAAQRAWTRARAYSSADELWLRGHLGHLERAMGRCFVVRAEADDNDATRIRALIRARDWDHRNPDQRRLAAPLADARYGDGMAARAEGDWDAAYRAFADAVALDPTRSWARRYAEQARAERLAR